MKRNSKKRFLSGLICFCMLLTALPTESLAYFVKDLYNADSDHTGEILYANEDGSTEVLEYDESWEKIYPYGAFVFGNYEVTASEDSTEGGNIVTVPVYRLGGTSGRATAYIRYQPVVSEDSEDSLTYAYAASGRDDITIQVEDPQPIAKYQPIGADKIYAGCDIDCEQGIIEGEDGDTEADYKVLSLSDDIEADDYVWQLLIMEEDGEELNITQDWTDIADAASSTLQVENDIFYSTEPFYDFRCIYEVDGKVYCTSTLNGIPFTETEEELPEMPKDVELNADPTYTTLVFEEEYDVCDFELTFAEGEWVKNIIITVTDDEIAELPEMGLFTIIGNEGGDVYHAAATLTLLINDNDDFEPSELGFSVEEVQANQDDGDVIVTVKRTGGMSYPISVKYETVPGTAVAGKQFSAVSGTLMFAGDVDSIDIKIPLIAEEKRDDTLEFSLRLFELQGGGTDELCTLENDTVTILLTSSGKSIDSADGLNLASVLAQYSGEDVSSNAETEDSLLPESVTVSGEQYDDSGTVEPAEYVKGSNARTYSYANGLQIRRSQYSNYSSYWKDWENAVGTKGGDSSGNMKYWNSFSTPTFIESSVTSLDDEKVFNKSSSGIEIEHNNTTGGSKLLIDDAGKYFSNVEWYFTWPVCGIARAGRSSDKYLYVMPWCWIGALYADRDKDWSWQEDWDGNAGTIPSSGSVSRDGSWSSSHALDIDFGTLNTYMELSLNYNNDRFAMGSSVLGTKDYDKGANGSSDLFLKRLSLQRRVFTNTSTIGLKIYTANDSDSGLGIDFPQLDENSVVYEQMQPSIELVEGQSGVTTDGNLYVGSTLRVKFNNTASYFALEGNKLNFSIYLTNSKGEKINVNVSKVKQTDNDKENVYTMEWLWDGMTEADLSESYTINIVMERRQTVTLDISTSLADDATAAEIDSMKATVKKSTVTYGYSKTVETGNHYTYVDGATANIDDSSSLKLPLTYGSGDNKNSKFTNLQYINFNLDEEDIILFNGRSYAGNANIYLTMSDLARSALTFYYYNKDTLSLAKTMSVTISDTALYYDGDGNGKIDGYYDEDSGYFVLDENSDDVALGFVSGEFDESIFTPTVDSNGKVHQYFLKVYYTMNPRSYQAPAGASENDTVMVMPLFMSTVTDSKSLGELTAEQKAYRYVKAGYSRIDKNDEYSDSSKGHLMYGEAASDPSYVDIPLGGDKSPVTYTIVTDDNNVQTKVYTWEPDYCGKLLVNFENPEPIYHENNITGDSIAIAGEEPVWVKTDPDSKGRGTLTVSADGQKKLNAYLASLVGNTTFGLAVQEETEITKVADIQPESVTKGNVRAIPNGDYLANTEGTGAPDDTDGGSGGNSAMPEFESDLGISLPSTEFALSDYASIIMDGYSVGFSIGLPIISGDQDTEKEDKTSMSKQVKNANEAMTTLKDFMNKVKQGEGRDKFKDIMKDDKYNDARANKADGKKEGIKSKGFSVSFSVALAILFEYNPIDNTYYFKQATIAASAGFEFTLQYRFTPVPILYVYLKTGFTLELSTGLSVERTAKEGSRITTSNWLYDVDGIVSKGLGTKLDAGESACFVVDISEVRGFRLYMDGSVYMEVIKAENVDDYKEAPNDYDGDYVVSGRLSSDGDEPSEVFMPDGDYTAYVVLTAIKPTTVHYAMEVSGAKSLVYWNGIQISPSGFIEVGAGIGIELLKFELYLKAQLSMQFTIGGYSEDAGKYMGGQMNNFDLALSMGFNVTVLFFNYSMDLIGYYLHGENTGDGSKWEGHWGALSDAIQVSKNGGNSTASLVQVTSPTDTSNTQRVVGDYSVSRAYDPTDDNAPFQLSGYGSSGDGFKLMDGLSTGASYKVFSVGDDNYILYTISRANSANSVDASQLVLSKIVLTGSNNDARLQSPDGSGTNIAVDNDLTGDLDYSYSISGNTLTVIWTSYASTSDSTSNVDTVTASKNIVVKTASIDLSAENPSFTTPEIISGVTESVPDVGNFRFLPQYEGNVSIWVESVGNGDSKNTLLKTYLQKVYGLTDDEAESGETTNYDHAAALYRYNYQKDLNAMYGSGNKLIAYANGQKIEKDLGNEVVENIETAYINNKVYAVYSTVEYRYFDESGKTASTINDKSELAAVKRLYLVTFDGNEWSSSKLLETVIDFDRSNGSTNYIYKDGVYSGGTLKNEQTDPYFSNIKFLNAKLSDTENVQTVLLYEMGGNTYIITETELKNAENSNTFKVTPIFSETEGTDAVISSDNSGNLAVVYTATMASTSSNALYVAWWDTNLKKWGTGNVLAMNHLQVYEDSSKYDMTPEELEKAYLGMTTGNSEYDCYIGSLSDEALESAKGAKEQLTFSNLQITLIKDSESGNEQLLVLTQGSLQKLKSTSVTNPNTQTSYDTVIPDGTPDMGFYAVSFGAGKQGIGNANLSLTNYDFTAGSKLNGSLTFTNTGTTAIRASNTEPAVVTLTASNTGYSQTIAKWQITESIPAGGKVELYFRMNSELTQDLDTGTVFSASISEDSTYIGEENAFSASTGELLKVEAKPELQFESFNIELNDVFGSKAAMETVLWVSNRGNTKAENVFIQFSYETSDGTYAPLDLSESSITVDDQTLIKDRSVTSNDYKNGIISLSGIDCGYQRKVHGTLNVPLSSFRQDNISGLHLKVEIFSDSDNLSTNNNVYSSSHSGEYCYTNNVFTTEIAHETFFSAPKKISMALGNTLRLPISLASTSANGAQINVREISDGTEEWTANLGLLYYDEQSGTIVAAPSENTVGKSGIIQVEDTVTNSYYSITYRITEQGTGVNIYKDDESFTFYEADGSKTDLTDKNQNWRFNENVPSWKGGSTENEVPMNNDTIIAMEDGAYFTFKTTADTIKLWFKGEVTIDSDLLSFSGITADSETLKKNGNYPLTVDFGNDSGAVHTVTVKAKLETIIDRYSATYSEYPIQTDAAAPQIYWNRSFPDTASIESDSGERVELICYVTDDSGLLSITGIPSGTVITKLSDKFWSFPMTVTENGFVTIKATDESGKTTTYPLRIDWFNSQVTSESVSTAPDFSDSNVTLQKEDGSLVTGYLPENEYPYIKSDYILKEGETMTVGLANGETSIDPEEDGRFKITENGIYRIRVTASDGSWAQCILIIDVIDDGTFTLSVTDEAIYNKLNINVFAGQGCRLEKLTVNGFNVIEAQTFVYTFGGEYEVFAENSVGRTLTVKVKVDVALKMDDDAVETEICTVYGEEDGKIRLALSGIHGGVYDLTVSDTEYNDYSALYTAAVVPIDDENAEPSDEAIATANFIQAENGEFLFEELATGWYRLIVKDSGNNTVYVNVFVDTAPLIVPDPTPILPINGGKHDIVTAEVENGVVVANPEKAVKGKEISIIAVPDSGYVIANITVVDENGNSVELTYNEYGRYTFTMPNCDVTVYADFALEMEIPFVDVNETDWFYNDVVYVYENSLMNGVETTVFSPNTATTRGMIVTILYRLEGKPAVSTECPFEDVIKGSYYEDAIAWAAENSIVGGYGDGNFGPDDNITREQMAAILYRYAKYKGIDVSIGENTDFMNYADSSEISEYAVSAMQWVCGVGIIKGSDGYLLPTGNATRAQVAAILHRFCENILKEES